MSAAVQPYLVWYTHPIYPNRSAMIQAVDLPTAQAAAAASCTGLWTVVSVTLYPGTT